MGVVVCCLFGGKGCDRVAEGILGAGQRLARGFGVPAAALILGSPASGLVERAAAVADEVHTIDDKVLEVDEPERLLNALAQACSRLEPVAVLLGGDPLSQELAPRLAHRLKGSASGDAVALNVMGGEVHVTRPVYGGKAQAVMALRGAPAVVWLRARAIQPADSREGAPAPVSALPIEVKPDNRVRVVTRHAEAREATRLEDARWIVSGGRGLGGPGPFERLRELADVLGGQVAASRAACDAGWVPPNWQVGQTGKKVAPELYIAIAISGASQHLMGIADARVIAAINTDKDAPIFKHCRFGLVEDYAKVVGPLRERLAGLMS